MKTRTNQPVFLDNGQPVDDSKLGGTKLYKHNLVFTNGDSTTQKISFITTKKDAYIKNDFVGGEEKLNTLTKDFICFSVDTPNGMFGMDMGNGVNIIKIVPQASKNVLTTIYAWNCVSLKDTISEL